MDHVVRANYPRGESVHRLRIGKVEVSDLHMVHVREVVPGLRHVVGTDANEGTSPCQNPRRLHGPSGMTAADHPPLPAKVDSRDELFGRRLGTESGVQRLLIRLHNRDSGTLAARVITPASSTPPPRGYAALRAPGTRS